MERAIHGALGAVLGVALARPYAWPVVRVVATAAPFSVSTDRLVPVVVVLTLLTAAAGTVPAARTSRAPPVPAVAQNR
ncbi:hypothetical protein [Streptomyces sp. NPDC058632]|uniref:hypothetical protein n=1 Tax=unclassified Streptomyces TaxID=2593676 RepID=UPI0036534700